MLNYKYDCKIKYLFPIINKNTQYSYTLRKYLALLLYLCKKDANQVGEKRHDLGRNVDKSYGLFSNKLQPNIHFQPNIHNKGERVITTHSPKKCKFNVSSKLY